MKQLGGGNYWKELLDRIRDIRSSEKVLYRQVLDFYATSVDYDPKNEESIKFFKIVQNISAVYLLCASKRDKMMEINKNEVDNIEDLCL